MSHRTTLTLLVTLLLSLLGVVAPTGSGATQTRVSVEADEVTTAVQRVREVELEFPAQHVAAYWRGHPGARVTLSFSSDGVSYDGPVDASRDEVGEQRRNGTTYGAVLDAGGARWVRVRSDRPIARLTVLGMRDGSARTTTVEQPAAGAAADTSQPPVRSRAEWGADERLRSGAPSFARVKKLIVHHTATGNGYSSPDESESQLRSILRYHTVTQRWSDIGYNFLIDKFGTIYEGRWSRAYVGVDPSGDNAAGEGVVGAHTGGWNTGSMGVAMLGTHTERDITPAARRALERLLAWQSARNGIDPAATQRFTNPSSKATITTPNIAGHRDYKATECPGGTFHRTLPALRAAVAAEMGEAPADTTAPTRPTDLVGSPRRRRVLLDWQPSTDDSAEAPRYRVLRSRTAGSGTFRRVATVQDPAYVDTGLRRRRTFYYVVRAADAVGNLSGASNQVRVRTR